MNEYYVIRHHGIKGMHWGVRRYQNEDGTLTAAGRKRQALQDRRDRDDRADEKHENIASSIYKREQQGSISRKDAKRQYKEAWDKYSDEIKKSHSQYKAEKKAIRADVAEKTSNTRRLLTSKKGIGTADRVREKQRMFEEKIKKGGDSNIVTRNIVNDWRAGRHAQLERKAEHRAAKLNYVLYRTPENKRRLNEARVNRVLKNGVLGSMGASAVVEGKYKRYRQNGKSVVQATLLTGVGTYLTAGL